MSWVEVALLGAVIASLVVSFAAILVAVGAKFRLTQLEQDQTATELRVTAMRGHIYGVVEGGGLLNRQAETEQLLDMLIDCQDQMEKDLYGDADTEGLQESFRELEDEGDALTDRLSKVEQRLKAAGWTVTDDPADLFKPQQERREERCIAGQCNPSDCDREQCPHRTQEFVVAPYSGLLDNFAAEWDQVLSQGQVELPVQVQEKTVTPIWNGDAELVAIRYTQTEGVSPTTQPPTKGSK